MQLILNGNTIEVASVHMVLLDGTDMWAGVEPAKKRGRKPKSDVVVVTTEPTVTNGEQKPKRGYNRKNKIEMEPTTVGNCYGHGIYNKLDSEGKIIRRFAVAVVKVCEKKEGDKSPPTHVIVGHISELQGKPDGEVKADMTVKAFFYAKIAQVTDVIKHD